MPDHAAFLKGINLGNRRLSNDELRGHVEALGLAETAIFRASGNVVFSDPKRRGDDDLAALIEAGLEERLGYPIATFVRSGEELRELASSEPFDAPTRRRLAGKEQIALLAQRPPAKARREALALAGEDDALALCGRELHWLPRGRTSDSKLELKALERLLGPMTIRTRGTVEQIVARYFAAPSG